MSKALFILTLIYLQITTSVSFGRSDFAQAYFADGDRISGNLLESEGEDFLNWATQYINGKTSILTESLLEIHLPNDPINASDGGNSTIQLTNGDTLIANIDGLDSDHLHLSSPIFGKVAVNRGMIRYLKFKEKSKRLYSGPLDEDDWKMNTSAWEYKNRSFVSKPKNSGSVVRSFETKDRFHFSFQANWKTRLSLRIYFLADSQNPNEINNGFRLNLRNQSVDLRKVFKEGDQARQEFFAARAQIEDFSEKTKAKLELFVDKKEGAILFKVNGKVYGNWSEQNMLNENFGSNIVFVSEGDYRVKLSEIQMEDWGVNNREFEVDKITPLIPRETENDHVVVLANSDLVRGEIDKIEDGVLHMISNEIPVKFPTDRIRYLRLSPRPYDEAKRLKGDIRAYFNENQYITFQLKGFKEDKLIAHSQTFGDASFEVAAFTKLLFNIYNFKFRKQRKERW